MAAAHEERKQVPLTSLHGEEDTERIVVDEGERAPFFAKQREKLDGNFRRQDLWSFRQECQDAYLFWPQKKEEYFFLIVIHCDKAGFFCLD